MLLLLRSWSFAVGPVCPEPRPMLKMPRHPWVKSKVIVWRRMNIETLNKPSPVVDIFGKKESLKERGKADAAKAGRNYMNK